MIAHYNETFLDTLTLIFVQLLILNNSLSLIAVSFIRITLSSKDIKARDSKV